VTRLFTQNAVFRRAMLLVLCALVLFFAFHAKLAIYDGGAPVKITPSTASKLWLSSQKMEAQTLESASAILFWIAFSCLFSLYLRREPRVSAVLAVPPPRYFALRYLHRFLRPPPAQS
jgi:hypothetical protein